MLRSMDLIIFISPHGEMPESVSDLVFTDRIFLNRHQFCDTNVTHKWICYVQNLVLGACLLKK